MVTIATKQIETDWVVTQGAVDMTSVGLVRDKATVETLLGAKNEVWLGRPEVFDLRTIGAFDESPMLASTLSNSDLLVVQFACSFRPSKGCEFVRASVGVSLDVSKDGETVENPAIVYDLFPMEVFVPVTCKRKIAIDPHLKFEVVKVLQTEISAFEIENTREFIVYQPEVTSYGKGGSIAGWDFNKSSARPIIGVKDLFILVKRESGVPVSVTVTVSDCVVQTELGPLPLKGLFASKIKGVLIEESYTLS